MIQDIVFETSYRLQSDFELKKEKVLEDSRVERERYTNSHLNQQLDDLLINMCNGLAASIQLQKDISTAKIYLRS